MALAIDLNADLGEECGDDLAMLELVTSASIAAGGHAGGGSVLVDAVGAAAQHGVAVGAHVSYPDRASFGRESWRGRDLSGLADELVAQMTAVADAARQAGIALRHVKAHGALYNDAAVDPEVADVLATAIAAFGRAVHPAVPAVLGVFAPPGSTMAQRCAALDGIRVVGEAFADRAYRADGTLVPRGEPGAVLVDGAEIADRAVAMVREGRVVASDGSELALRARTLCLHGDTPDAVELARTLVVALARAGILIRPWDA